MYILFIVLIFIASAILILAVLAQNPKGGMAANFGASNQVMGTRQTADFLEKLTWGLVVAIVAFSLCATMAMPRESISDSNMKLQNKILENTQREEGLGEPFALPLGDTETPAGESTENAVETSTPEATTDTPATEATPQE